jgi:hypothetical protein
MEAEGKLHKQFLGEQMISRSKKLKKELVKIGKLGCIRIQYWTL